MTIAMLSVSYLSMWTLQPFCRKPAVVDLMSPDSDLALWMLQHEYDYI